MRLPQGYTVSIAILGLALLAGCASNPGGASPGMNPHAAAEDERAEVRAVAHQTLQDLYARQPGAKQAIANAAGYAVFSNFGMKILVAGGGTGKGLAVNNATQREVFMRMAEVQAGLGFGVKNFRVVWVFGTQQAFDDFVDNGYQLGGQATRAAQAGGAGVGLSGAVPVSKGVWLYQITDDGIAAEITVKGTRYYRDRDLD